jgi:hypothetical protein
VIEYSIVQDEKTDYVAVRSTVKSFGLDHVTDKDITTFFSSFSKYAHVDTGLLPLNGTGLLAYRQAANHSQIVIQHEPGIYRIMWGEHEGDKGAKHYFLAQPYRIVIGDIVDGSLLGARMFYSPVPITSPSNELYHVNLPNINCRGYRGNGVGWVCLYHNEDWSNIPIGEKVTRLMERCSGAEAYNDANMSETDGPRFYATKGKPTYLSLPDLWENKTNEEGFAWTLDPDLWLPILVTDRDNQGQHDDKGIPLTLGMALTGDYQAYYYDKLTTKPVNAIAREDKQYNPSEVFALVKKSYIESSTSPEELKKLDPYAMSIIVRSEYSLTSKGLSEETYECGDCGEQVTEVNTVYESSPVCESCFENYNYVESIGEHVHYEYSVWVESADKYYYIEDDDIENCSNCGYYHLTKENNIYSSNDNFNTLCTSCAPHDNLKTCHGCSCEMVVHPDYQNDEKKSYSLMSIDPSSDDSVSTKVYDFCQECINKHTVCPCGFLRSSDVYEHFEAGDWSLIAITDGSTCCKSCAIGSDQGAILYKTPIQTTEVAVAISNIKSYNDLQNENKIKENNDDCPF